MLEIMALRAPVSPRPLAVTPERAAWLQRVAFALQVLLAARSGIPRSMAVSPASAPQEKIQKAESERGVVNLDTS
jgi:hypothetical protein